MPINEMYEIADSDVRYKDKDVVATVRITNGDFKGAVFYFGEISFADEENTDGTYSISFNYDIITEEHKVFQGTEAFESQLGEILNDLLRNALDEADRRYKDELRKENTQTPIVG